MAKRKQTDYDRYFLEGINDEVEDLDNEDLTRLSTHYTIGAEEVARQVGITKHTLDIWYKFKRENPKSPYCTLLPPYMKKGRVRYWNQMGVYKLKDFKEIIPHGRNGILGKVTSKYSKKIRI